MWKTKTKTTRKTTEPNIFRILPRNCTTNNKKEYNVRIKCQACQLEEGLDFVKSEVRILRIRVESGETGL